MTDKTDAQNYCDRTTDEENDITAVKLGGDYNVGRLDSIRLVLGIVLMLVIAIAFYVVSSTGSLIINYRIPILGTFRSVGATASETNLILIGENVIYGLAASIPGVIFGELIRSMVIGMFLGTKVQSINIAYVLIIPLFTSLMNIVISVFAVIKTGKKPVKELIFGKQSAVSHPSLIAGFIGLALIALSAVVAYLNTDYSIGLLVAELILGIIGMGMSIGLLCLLFSKLFSKPVLKLTGGPGWLGVRNLAVNKTNRSTALLVASVMSLVLMIYICVGSISDFFVSYEGNYPYDIMIKGFSDEREEDLGYLSQIEGVTKVICEYWDFSTPIMNREKTKTCFCAVDGYSNGIEMDESLADNLKDGEAIVDRLYAAVHKLKIGDTLYYQKPDNSGNNISFKFRVVGFCEAGVFNSARTTVVITRDDFFRYIEQCPAIVGIWSDRDLFETMVDISDAFSAHEGKTYNVNTSEEFINHDMKEAMSALQAVSAVPVLTVILALCGLVNNQLIAFNQKKMQYAVLYSTAMSRSQLGRMMFAELLYAFIVGCSGGLAMCFWLTKILRDIIFVAVSYVPISVTFGQIAISLAFLFVLLCVTSIFPQKRLKKLDIVKEIKYE